MSLPKGFKTLEERWEGFAKFVFAGMQVPTTQYIETRRAFYGGMIEMFKMVRDDLPDQTEEVAFEMLTACEKQIDGYRAELAIEVKLWEARKRGRH